MDIDGATHQMTRNLDMTTLDNRNNLVDLYC